MIDRAQPSLGPPDIRWIIRLGAGWLISNGFKFTKLLYQLRVGYLAYGLPERIAIAFLRGKMGACER